MEFKCVTPATKGLVWLIFYEQGGVEKNKRDTHDITLSFV